MKKSLKKVKSKRRGRLLFANMMKVNTNVESLKNDKKTYIYKYLKRSLRG